MARTAAVVSIVLASGLVASTLAPAHADTCAQEPVTARGENSRFVWTAKTKARANWRREVRGTPGLGPDYGDWGRAQGTEERCLSGPAGTVCIFTGTPCKR